MSEGLASWGSRAPRGQARLPVPSPGPPVSCGVWGEPGRHPWPPHPLPGATSQPRGCSLPPRTPGFLGPPCSSSVGRGWVPSRRDAGPCGPSLALFQPRSVSSLGGGASEEQVWWPPLETAPWLPQCKVKSERPRGRAAGPCPRCRWALLGDECDSDTLRCGLLVSRGGRGSPGLGRSPLRGQPQLKGRAQGVVGILGQGPWQGLLWGLLGDDAVPSSSVQRDGDTCRAQVWRLAVLSPRPVLQPSREARPLGYWPLPPLGRSHLIPELLRGLHMAVTGCPCRAITVCGGPPGSLRAAACGGAWLGGLAGRWSCRAGWMRWSSRVPGLGSPDALPSQGAAPGLC